MASGGKPWYLNTTIKGDFGEDFLTLPNAENPPEPNPWPRQNPHAAGPVIFDEEDGAAATKPIRSWADIEEQAEATAALVERLEAEHYCIGCGVEFADLDELADHEVTCY